MTQLDLGFNQISNIDALENLINLTELDLSGNQITETSSLVNLHNLKELNLGKNQINDIHVLANLPSLTILHLDDIIWLEEQFPNCEIRFEYDIEDSNDDESWLE